MSYSRKVPENPYAENLYAREEIASQPIPAYFPVRSPNKD